MEELIKLKLRAMGKPIVNSGYPYILTSCLNPHHNDKHPSFSVNLTTGNGKCFGCGYYVSDEYWINGEMSDEEIEELVRKNKFNSLKEKFKKEEEIHPQIFLPPKDEEVEDGWRGLTAETIKKLDLYKCNTGHYAGRIIFPMKNQYGNVSAFNTRAYVDGVEPKYKYSKGIKVNELIYPSLDFYSEKKNYIVVVEGIMDAISMAQDGIPAMLNFGINNTIGTKKIGQLLSAGVETIYLGLDNDEAGLKGIKNYLDSDLSEYFEVKLAVTLPELEEFYKSGCKDYNDFVQGIGVKNEEVCDDYAYDDYC